MLLHSVGHETIVTDCKSLLDSLRFGPVLATAAGRSMARLRGMIFAQVGDDGFRVRLHDEGGHGGHRTRRTLSIACFLRGREDDG